MPNPARVAKQFFYVSDQENTPGFDSREHRRHQSVLQRLRQRRRRRRRRHFQRRRQSRFHSAGSKKSVNALTKKRKSPKA